MDENDAHQEKRGSHRAEASAQGAPARTMRTISGIMTKRRLAHLSTTSCIREILMRTCILPGAFLLFIASSCSKSFNPLENSSEQTKDIIVSAPQLLIPNGKHPRWSPDDQWIAYALYSGSSSDIYIASRDGGGARQITTDDGNDEYPFWAPDGNTIGFSSDRRENQNYNIFTVSLDGTEITQATPDSIGVQAGDWSPNGESIVFDGINETLTLSANSILVITPANKQIAFLTTNLAYAGRPKFSPDGKKIVFEALEHNSPLYNIWTINADGTALKKITTAGGEYPCWSPGGAWIAYSNMATDNYDLYIIGSDGGQPIQVTHSTDANEVRASWSSNDNFIIYDTMMGTKKVSPNNAGIYLIQIDFLDHISKQQVQQSFRPL